MGSTTASSLAENIRGCTLCRDRFLLTKTAHSPRPVTWFQPEARILIAGQAPGLRVHEDGRPFWDRSGDRLRDWLGVNKTQFYDKTKLAIVPMAFCFPGYSAKGTDLPPPPICALTWRDEVMAALPNIRLRIVIGAYAQRYHLGDTQSVTARVLAWKDHAPATFVLPHPSWRNNAWLKANPFFETDVLPELRLAVKAALNDTHST